jgi:acyl-CoA thioester hydrolase
MMRTDFSNCLTATEHVRIPFHDVDPAGVVWHGRYFKYFEAARRNLLDTIDYSYQQMINSGFVWPIVDTAVRFVHPLTLNQQYTVTACLREWEMRLVVDYKVEDAGGKLYTKARTVQVPVGAVDHELRIGSPEILIENVRRRMESLGKP